MMINYPTIVQYLVQKFCWYLVLTSLAVIALLFIAGAFDVLQKFKAIYFSPQEFWLLITLKIPYLFNEVGPVISLASTVLFLNSLVIYNELIIITSSGIQLWRVFLIPVIASFLLGIIIVAVINPVSSYSLKEYERIEAKLQGTIPQNSVVISSSGVFFCEKYENTNRIIRAVSINAEKKLISNMVILITDKQNRLIERVDTQAAHLDNGQFDLQSPVVYKDKKQFTHERLFLPTSLSINNLMQSFMLPEMFSVWDLPESIKKMHHSGLQALGYEIYFFKQLFKPLAMSAMSLLACWFLSLNNRSKANVKNMIFSLLTGLVTYFLLEIILRLLSFGGFSPMLAALLPILVIILISNFVILHLQEA